MGRKSNTVFYKPGKGWHYRLHGDERGPFESPSEAELAMQVERDELRAIRRAAAGEPMTFADQRRELAW